MSVTKPIVQATSTGCLSDCTIIISDFRRMSHKIEAVFGTNALLGGEVNNFVVGAGETLNEIPVLLHPRPREYRLLVRKKRFSCYFSGNGAI